LQLVSFDLAETVIRKLFRAAVGIPGSPDPVRARFAIVIGNMTAFIAARSHVVRVNLIRIGVFDEGIVRVNHSHDRPDLGFLEQRSGVAAGIRQILAVSRATGVGERDLGALAFEIGVAGEFS
jgi:hypothetical protein